MKKCGDYIHELASASGCDKASIYMPPGNHDLERSDRRLNSLKYYIGMNYSKGKRTINHISIRRNNIERIYSRKST